MRRLLLKILPMRWMEIYLLGGLLLHFLLPSPAFRFSWFWPMGVAVFLLGYGMMMWSWLLFTRAGTGVVPGKEPTTELVVNGPFGWSRNPMYIGMVLMPFGVALFLRSVPIACASLAFFATFNFSHIPSEEEALRRQFGQTFDDYARKVRRWL